jgi:hypothetical protein
MQRQPDNKTSLLSLAKQQKFKNYFLNHFRSYKIEMSQWAMDIEDATDASTLKELLQNIGRQIDILNINFTFTAEDLNKNIALYKKYNRFREAYVSMKTLRDSYLPIFNHYKTISLAWKEIADHPKSQNAIELKSTLIELQNHIHNSLSTLESKSTFSIEKRNKLIEEFNKTIEKCEEFNNKILLEEKKLLRSFFVTFSTEVDRWEKMTETYYGYCGDSKPYNNIKSLRIDVNNTLDELNKSLESKEPLEVKQLSQIKNLAQDYSRHRTYFSDLARKALAKFEAKKPIQLGGALTYAKPDLDMPYCPNLHKAYTRRSTNDGQFEKEREHVINLLRKK